MYTRMDKPTRKASITLIIQMKFTSDIPYFGIAANLVKITGIFVNTAVNTSHLLHRFNVRL